MDFLFDVQKHCLYFEARNVNAESFPPRNVKRVFEHLLNMPELIERFGMVDVTIIPSSEALETIFSMEGLAKLRIHVVRPNPDDNYLTHTAVLERLRRQHAQSMDIEYSKERSADKLEPDQETRALAEIAATNGFVNGDGKGPNNEPRHESTKGHPMVEPIVIKDSMDPFEQLIAFAMSRRL